MNDIITSDNGDYANKHCKCATCGIIRKCTFDFDFFPYVDAKGSHLLQCEHCLMKAHFGSKTPPTIIINPDGKIENKNFDKEDKFEDNQTD